MRSEKLTDRDGSQEEVRKVVRQTYAAAQAMAEIGIRLDDHRPKPITEGMVGRADRTVTMGCGVDFEACLASFIVSVNWGLEAAAGQPIEAVCSKRDQVGEPVAALLHEVEG